MGCHVAITTLLPAAGSVARDAAKHARASREFPGAVIRLGPIDQSTRKAGKQFSWFSVSGHHIRRGDWRLRASDARTAISSFDLPFAWAASLLCTNWNLADISEPRTSSNSCSGFTSEPAWQRPSSSVYADRSSSTD